MDPANEIRIRSETKLIIRGESKGTTWAEMLFIVSKIQYIQMSSEAMTIIMCDDREWLCREKA